MKKMLIGLCLLPFTSYAMENSMAIKLREAEIAYLPWPASTDKTRREAITQEVQKFTDWFEGSRFTDAFLTSYRDCLLEANPQAKTRLEELIGLQEIIAPKVITVTALISLQHKVYEAFEEAEKNNKLSSESYAHFKKQIELQTKTTYELTALTCVQAFVNLELLKTKSEWIEKTQAKP